MKNDLLEIIEDFIDYLKDKEIEKKEEKEVKIIEDKEEMNDDVDDDFEKEIVKISKGE